MSPDAEFERLRESAVFTALGLGSQRLLLPQADVEILELLSQLRPAPVPGPVGEIDYQRQPWPVYSLDKELALQTRADRSRYMCALLKSANGGFYALACDQVAHVAREGLELQRVPECMRTESMPVAALAAGEDRPLWLSTARRIERWLDAAGANLHG